jgi:hypothetical protein
MNKYQKKDGTEGMNLKLSKSVIMQIGMPEELPKVATSLPVEKGEGKEPQAPKPTEEPKPETF